MVCLKEFSPKGNTRTCSKECSLKNKNKPRNRCRINRVRRLPKKEKVCECCGAKFIASVQLRKYCSFDCRYESRIKKQKQATIKWRQKKKVS